MSNHGDDINNMPDFLKHALHEKLTAARDAFAKRYTGPEQLGATGRFPLGKLTPDDEGELRMAIAADPTTKTIILDFGKPVAWLGLPRDDARTLAETILRRLKEIE